MKKTVPQFKVLTFGFNSNKVDYYDVMPAFIDKFKSMKKCSGEYKPFVHKPRTMEEMKDFVMSYGMYRFWSKCEYECVVSSWPCFYDREAYKKWVETLNVNVELENVQNQFFTVPDFRKCEEKIDVWEQIGANIDLVTTLLYNYLVEK